MEIKAFKAYRFNKDIVGNPGSCIAPPYDVIDEQMQQQLYDTNPYNIVRIDWGQVQKEDNQANNKYTRAGDYLKLWIDDGVLVREDAPGIYAYVQNFDVDGIGLQRSGFIALGKLEEFSGKVKPHEKTLDGPKADRLNLTKATQAQFGQIFMLYNDPSKTADTIIDNYSGHTPVLDQVDKDSVRHRLFVIANPDHIAQITAMILDKDAIIADGHHRYETALNYYKLTGNPNAQYQMMTFINMHNEGLVILPTHRLVGNLNKFDPMKLISDLHEDFEVNKYNIDQMGLMLTAMQDCFSKKQVAFGFYAKTNNFYLLVLKNPNILDGLVDNMSGAWKSLDVSILHKAILEKHLAIGDAQLAAESNIEYIKDIDGAKDKAVKQVNDGKMQAVFFMNPTRIEQVMEVAKAGEKMPQKSTFFHPKIFSGLTINVID